MRRGEQRAAGGEELRVSTIELFFDLVFVFTLTQLTSLLEEITLESVTQVILIFVVLFWMYGGYAWLTNQVPPDRPLRRLLMIVGMGAFFVCALAIPETFEGAGLGFGLGYLVVILVHFGLYAQVYGLVVGWLVGLNVVAALCLIAAGLIGDRVGYALWIAAVVILFLTPKVAARASTQLSLRPAHFVERHGLLLIVALGESIVAIGIGVHGIGLQPRVFAAAVLGLALTAALWWAYFIHDEEGAERAMRDASDERKFALAINGYFFSFIPILLGVTAAAAGVEQSLAAVSEEVGVRSAVLLAGGVAFYLIGNVAFRLVMGIRPIALRLAAAAAVLPTTLLGSELFASAQLVAVVLIVVATLAAEAWWRTRTAAA